MIKKGLGKGLGALFSVYEDDEKEFKNIETYEANTKVANEGENINNLPIEMIIRNENQPRKNFDEESLKELAESIKTYGVIQPIIVSKNFDKYIIIAGERRFRATKIAGLKEIPVIIKEYTPRQIKEIAIIENLQREDLNPIETAKAIKEVMTEYNLTQDEMADRLGKSRSNITNTLRLLQLEKEVISLIEEKKLTAGHARTLVVVTDKNKQIKLAKEVAEKGLSVRELENLVKDIVNPPKKKIKTKQQISLELQDLVESMQRVFSTKVGVIGNDTKGRISIDYFSRDDLDRIVELVEKLSK